MSETLPTREQIEAITDADALIDLRDDLEAMIARIEVDLDYRPGDEDWAARARGALVAHNICFGQVCRQLHRTQKAGKVRPSGKSPEVISAKASKAEAVAERLRAEKQAKEARNAAARIAQQDRVAGVLERTSWLALFHNAAVRMLSADTVAQITEAATRDQCGRMRHEIKTAA